MAAPRSPQSLLIAFVDLTRFAAQSQRIDDQVLADTIDSFYELVAATVQSAGGKVVKFLGDAALIVFPEDVVDQAVETLLTLKTSVDQMMSASGWECRLAVKVHFGSVIAGLFGARDEKRYDVIGKDVNTTAMLEASGVTLTVDAFGKLGSELRTRFKKQTPPVTYIDVEGSPRFRQRNQ